MAVAPFEIVAGPAQVWIAPTGTAFPDVTADPASPWDSLGETEGGVTVSHTQDLELITTDQTIAPVKAIRTESGLDVSFSIAQLTLENYSKALDDATITAVAATAGPPATPATKEIPLYRGYEMGTNALLVRGPSPYVNGNQQYQVPVVVQTEEPEVEFVKDDKAVLSVTFTAMALLGVPEDQKFGKLIAQSA